MSKPQNCSSKPRGSCSDADHAARLLIDECRREIPGGFYPNPLYVAARPILRAHETHTAIIVERRGVVRWVRKHVHRDVADAFINIFNSPRVVSMGVAEAEGGAA